MQDDVVAFKRMLLALLTMTLLVATVAAPSADSGRAVSELDDSALLAELEGAADDDSRAEILAVLAERRSETVRNTLEVLAEDAMRSDMLRMQAICALAGSANHKSVPLLLKILENDLSERRGFWACAIPILGGLGDRSALPLLKRIANHGAEHLAGMDHMAIEAIAALADERDVRFLESKANIWAVRPALFVALARIADPSSAETLVSGLGKGEDPEVVRAAQIGLRAIGARARPALEDALRFPVDDQFEHRARVLLQDME